MFFIYSKNAAKQKPADVRPYQKKASYVFKEDVSIREAAQLIGDGHAWRAGAYASGLGTFKKAEVLGSEIIALDFDCCQFVPESVVDYGEGIGFRPNFYYYSYSHGTKPGYNFRVVWVLESGITPKAYEECYKTILEIFSQFGPDGATKDCSRLWFGGKDAVVVNEEPVSLSSIGWLAIVNKAKEGIKLRDAVKGKKSCITDYAAIDDPEEARVNTSKPWWLCLQGKCPLWDKFARGEYLDYNQRLTLFTNLKYIRYTDNTTSIIDDIMSFCNYAAYKDHTFSREQLQQMMNAQVLKPIPIVKNLLKNRQFIRPTDNIIYQQGGQNGEKLEEKIEYLTVPEFLRLYYASFEPHYSNNTPKITLEEMTRIMADVIPKEIEDGGIKYFVSQTASGKTQHIINWIKKQDLTQTKVVVAQPRHELIDEFMERLAGAGITADTAPLYRVYKAQYTENQLMRLKIGLPSGLYDKQRSDVLRMLKNPDAKGLFVITHAMLVKIGGGEGVNYYFIDENIEQALIDKIELNQEIITPLINYLPEKHRQKILDLANSISTLEAGDYVSAEPLVKAVEDMTTTQRERYLDEIKVKKLIGGLFRIQSTDLFRKNFKDALFINKKSEFFTKMIVNKANVMMLTATPMSELLKKTYPNASDDIKFFTVPLTQNKGRIIQYMGNTGARGLNNSRVPDLVEYVKSKHKGEDLSQYTVLTFKGAEHLFKEAGFTIEENELFDTEEATIECAPMLHIANCSGLDRLKGKKIIIAGKYDYPQDEYETLYLSLYPATKSAPKRTTATIKANGREFSMFLYEDEALQRIQLDNIRYYTSQAAGRARALREQNGYVEVFCDYPLEEADEYYV